MTPFTRRIAPHVNAELSTARRLEVEGQAGRAFAHLERAQVLGQMSTIQHVRVHALMLSWAVRQRAWKEARGQVLRIVGAATKTVFGWVPMGNTGGANVSPFKPLPVPADLARCIEGAKGR